MAPIPPSSPILQTRAEGLQPLSKGMITSISVGAFFLAVFIAGIGVFVYCYIRASGIPETAQLPPGSESSSRVWFEKAASTPSSSPSSTPPLPASKTSKPNANAGSFPTLQSPLPHSSVSTPALRISLPAPAVARPPRLNTNRSSRQISNIHHHRLSAAPSLDDADAPPTPGTEFV